MKNSFDNLNESGEEFMSDDSKTKKFRFHSIMADAHNSCVYGIFEGGNSNEEGNFNKKISAKKYSRTRVGLDDFTDSPFFFLIHFPIDSDTGILMIQKYSDKSMNQEFKNLFREFFRQRKHNVRYQVFLSEKMKETFKKGSLVEKITIMQTRAGKGLQEKFHFLQEGKAYKIKLEISEINSPAVDFIKKIVSPEQDVDSAVDQFPDLAEFGIEKGKSSVTTHMNDDGNRAHVQMKDLGGYLDKIVPKEVIPSENKIIALEGGNYQYADMQKYIVNLLNNTVLRSLRIEK